MPDVIHRYNNVLSTCVLDDALVVERGVSARVVDNTELSQRHGKRKRLLVPVFVCVCRYGSTSTKADGAISGKKMGRQGPCQYYDERHVQQHEGSALIQALLDDISTGHRGKCRP